MKYLYTLLVLMLPLLGVSQVFDKTVEALNTNNVDLLDQYLDSSVDVTFVDKHKNLPKKKALEEIKQFLLTQGSLSASNRHSGSSRENNSNYKVIELNTTLAKYRVFVYTELIGDRRLIKELRFDKI